MLPQSIIPLFSLLLLFSTPISAFPSRTHCACTLVDTTTTRFNPESLPASEYTEKTPPDACARLGPALESLHAAHPDLYAEFLAHTPSAPGRPTPAAGEARPLSTTLLLQLSAHRELAGLGVVLPSIHSAGPNAAQPQGTAPPRIVCKTQIHRFPSVHDSLITLVVLKVLVALAVLAFVAECVTLALRWYVPRAGGAADRPQLHVLTRGWRRSSFEHVPEKSALRLSGEERRLLAVPVAEGLFSPGVDKKQRLYRSGDWTPRLGSGKKEFAAYVVEEDDDELSRPVM